MKKTPYKCHVFVCINERQGERKSCGGGNSKETRRLLKAAFRERGWSKTDVRVSGSLCLGLCDEGPNVVVYPQQLWFSGVTVDRVDEIVSEVEKHLRA
jgi:(2Fe-2S) ferredoxin